MINTLQVSKNFIALGFTNGQAEGLSEILFELIESHTDHLAPKKILDSLKIITKQDIDAFRQDFEFFRIETKKDIESLRVDTKKDIEALRVDTKKDIEAFRIETKQDIQSLRNEMDLRLDGLDKKIDYQSQVMSHKMHIGLQAQSQSLVIKLGSLIAVMFAIFTGVTQFMHDYNLKNHLGDATNDRPYYFASE